MKISLLTNILYDLLANNNNSWPVGVTFYAIEMLSSYPKEDISYSDHIETELLQGSPDWRLYSAVSSLRDPSDIANRLLGTKNRCEAISQSRQYEKIMLDMQSAALRQAFELIIHILLSKETSKTVNL